MLTLPSMRCAAALLFVSASLTAVCGATATANAFNDSPGTYIPLVVQGSDQRTIRSPHAPLPNALPPVIPSYASLAKPGEKPIVPGSIVRIGPPRAAALPAK